MRVRRAYAVRYLGRLFEVGALEVVGAFAGAIAQQQSATFETLDTQVGVAILPKNHTRQTQRSPYRTGSQSTHTLY